MIEAVYQRAAVFVAAASVCLSGKPCREKWLVAEGQPPVLPTEKSLSVLPLVLPLVDRLVGW